MKDLGYGEGYRYAHDFEGGIVGQQNLPENLAGRRYYEPTDRGFEAELASRLERVRAIYEQNAAAAHASDEGRRDDGPPIAVQRRPYDRDRRRSCARSRSSPAPPPTPRARR